MRVKIALIVSGFAVAIAPGLWPETVSAYPKCNVAACEKVGTHTRADVKTACAGAGIEYGQNAQSGSYGCIDRANDGGWIECDSKGECIAGRVASGNPHDLKSYLGTKAAPLKKKSQ